MQLAHLEGQELLHVVVDLSDTKSLCGRTSWPGRWLERDTPAEAIPPPTCVACLRKVRE